MNGRALLSVLLLVGICLACLAALDSVSRALRDRNAVALPPIDYVLDEVRLTRHSKGGSSRVELHATRVVHSRINDELEVYKPELRRLGTELDTVTATAARARVHSGNDQIDLSGGVRLERQNSARTMVLETSTLEVRVEAQTAQTADPVEIREGTSILSGRGLKANLSTARYQILADLKARYVPAQRPKPTTPAPAQSQPEPGPQPVAAGGAGTENRSAATDQRDGRAG